MARRNGRKGEWLFADDYTGFTRYSSKAQKDYWGNIVVKPLKRNLQEIASPLNDPRPVPFFRGGQYEQTTACEFETAPLFVGTTNVPTNPNNPAFQTLNLDPAIPDMEVGCTFVVH